MLKESTLKYYEETSHDLMFDDGYTNIGKLNLAAFLGERAHYMLETIRELQATNEKLSAAPDLLAACQKFAPLFAVLRQYMPGPDLDCLERETRAAIAKAMGG